MGVTLSVQSDALSAEALQDLTRDLCRTLNREADVRATVAEAAAGPGTRAAGIEQTNILVQILAHGGGVVVGEMVLMLLRPYFERLPSLLIRAQGGSGKTATLSLESLHPERLEQTVRDIHDVLGSEA